jgi:Fe-S-cluster containining protein
MEDTYQFNNDMEFLAVRGGVLCPSGTRALFPQRCLKLEGDNVCTIYETRPQWCKDCLQPADAAYPEWLKDFGCRFFEDE